MSIQLILLGLLMVSIGFFLIQCIMQAGMKIDAAYVIGFCTYFDMFGYFYKRFMPGNALFLLIAVPLVPALIAWFGKEREVRRSLLRDQGGWLWIVVLLYAFVSLSWAPSGTAGLSKLIILIVHAVIPGIYAYILYKRYAKFSWTLFALFGLVFAVTHLVFGEYSPEYPGRLSLPGSNPIFNARMSLITLTVCLWAPGIPRLIRIAALIAAAVSALATESRGPLAAFLIANVLIAVLTVIHKYRRGEIKHLTRYAAVLFLLIAGAGLAVARYSFELQTWMNSSRLSIFFDRSRLQGDANYIGRLGLQRHALEEWSRHPFLGGGLGSLTPPMTRDFPHNVVLEIAGELGVLGLLLWSLAFLYSLWAARRHAVLAVLLLQTLGTALLSGDFGYNFEYVLLSFLALALVPGAAPASVPWQARASDSARDPSRASLSQGEDGMSNDTALLQLFPLVQNRVQPDSRRCSRKMRKILFVITGLNVAGAETQVVQLCKSFKAKGCQIELVSMLEPAAYLEELRELEVKVHSLGMTKGVADPRAIFRLRRIIAAFQPDIVHSHLVHANLLARITRLFVRMPRLICSAHSRTEGGKLLELLYRLTDPLCDLTTNVSREAVVRYMERRIAPAHKIRFVPNGIETARFQRAETQTSVRPELGIGPDDYLWLAAGRLVPEKDYKTLIAAFARVATQEPGAALLIAGIGPEREALEQLCRSLKVERRVYFLGMRRDIPDLMREADGYVMSSLWEGMPMVLLEAGASALPVVATDVGGNREAVRDGVSGFLVHPGNPSLMSERMLAVMSLTLQERLDMGEHGRRYIEANYEMETVIRQWMDIYEQRASQVEAIETPPEGDIRISEFDRVNASYCSGVNE